MLLAIGFNRQLSMEQTLLVILLIKMLIKQLLWKKRSFTETMNNLTEHTAQTLFV